MLNVVIISSEAILLFFFCEFLTFFSDLSWVGNNSSYTICFKELKWLASDYLAYCCKHRYVLFFLEADMLRKWLSQLGNYFPFRLVFPWRMLLVFRRWLAPFGPLCLWQVDYREERHCWYSYEKLSVGFT